MSCKNKNIFKVASILLIGAFSLGLSISCVVAHKKETIKVSAAESDGTWTLSNGSLSFQYTDWQSNGYVEQTNQIMVYYMSIIYMFYQMDPLLWSIMFILTQIIFQCHQRQ